MSFVYVFDNSDAHLICILWFVAMLHIKPKMSERGISGRTMADAVSRALKGVLKLRRGSGAGGSSSAIEGIGQVLPVPP